VIHKRQVSPKVELNVGEKGVGSDAQL